TLPRGARMELNGKLHIMVLGGPPSPAALFCSGGGRAGENPRRFVHEQPRVWHDLLERLATATSHFLTTLVQHGADVYQLFDSWAGMLTRAEYEQWAQPFQARIFREATGVPRILFVKEGPHLDLMATSGAHVVSLGTSHDLAAARRAYPHLVFQGNVNEEILRAGTPEQVREATHVCVRAGGGQRHIVNLSHGVDRGTPVENFVAYVEAAKGGAAAT